MEVGLFTEFQCPAGMAEATAFDESMAQMRAAEERSAVWLGELHFQKERSVLASPLVVAGALAGCTQRIKIGIAVQVLPLSHPLRLAEDVATVDHSRGRLDFGVGRSGLPGHYQGFNIPYEESRDRFFETSRSSGVDAGPVLPRRTLLPVPRRVRHPEAVPEAASPLRVAATTEETHPTMGRLGHRLRRGADELDLRPQALRRGLPRGVARGGASGQGEVALLVPVYVAESARQAREEPEASTMHWFRAIAEALSRSSTQHGRTQAERLAAVSYTRSWASRSSTGRRTLWSASGCCARSWGSPACRPG